MDADQKIKRASSYLLWLLARRDYPRKTLEEKLKKRELAPAEIKSLLDSFVEQGFYNENNFKKQKTRQLVRRGYGPKMVQYKLSKDKVIASAEDITAAHEELSTTPENQLKEQIQKLLRRYSSQNLSKQELRQKLFQALHRRGFSSSHVLKELSISLENA